MNRLVVLLLAAAIGVSAPAVSAQRSRPQAPRNPPAREHPDARPDRDREGKGGETPHVSRNHWYGHAAPNDPRFHLDRPFEHGRFRQVGRSHRFSVLRIDRTSRRFWLPGGFGFEIALWDWPLVDTWCWDCGVDFVIYDDPDHPGWYLLYNLTTAQYVHVIYLGV